MGLRYTQKSETIFEIADDEDGKSLTFGEVDEVYALIEETGQRPPLKRNLIAACLIRVLGEPVTAVCLFNYTGPSIEGGAFSIRPGSGWLTSWMIDAVAICVFHHLGCVRFTAMVESTNARSAAFCGKLGMKQEGIMRSWFGEGRDAIAFGLMRSEAPRRNDNGRRTRHTSSTTTTRPGGNSTERVLREPGDSLDDSIHE